METLESRTRISSVNILSIVCFILFAYAFYRNALRIYYNFPYSYSWGEIFIKYTDTYIRRGLLGEILYRIDAVIPVRYFWTITATCIAAAFYGISYRVVSKLFDSTATLILFFTPSYFMFLVYDPAVFGRKDFIILLAMFAICYMIYRTLTGKTSFITCLILSEVFYFIALLTHEMAFFFVFVPFCLMLCMKKNTFEQWCFILVAAVTVVLSLYLMLYFQGTPEMREQMYQEWHSRYPLFDREHMGGMEFIGVAAQNWLFDAIDTMTGSISMPSFLLAFLLSILPFWICLDRKIFPLACRSYFGKYFYRCFFIMQAFPMVTLMFIFTDYGRILSYCCIICLMSYCTIMYAYKWHNPDYRHQVPVLSLQTPLLLPIILLYLYAWRLVHCASSWESFIEPHFYLQFFRYLIQY